MAGNHSIELSGYINDDGYEFSDFRTFLEAYDTIGRVIKKGSDLYNIALHYLSAVAKEGTTYVELSISPMHSIENGISFLDQIQYLTEAIDQAHDKTGIFSSIILTAVRHRGAKEAIKVAKLAEDCESKLIRGFGLAGNENHGCIADFIEAYQIAEGRGLGLTAHVGEWGPAASVMEAVDTLNLDRVGHGIRATEQPTILSELSERGIGFELCISSNVRLGAVEGYRNHPMRKMIDYGCRFNLATDDPAYFKTSPQNETLLVQQHMGLERQHIVQSYVDSVQMAFCDNGTKVHLLNKAGLEKGT